MSSRVASPASTPKSFRRPSEPVVTLSDTAQRGTKLPSLDGWRALSIALVLTGHSVMTDRFPSQFETVTRWVGQADLGVRMFLVISGFLITYLLLREERATGRIDLRRFYARRALRILPVYFAFLLLLALVQVSTAFSQPGWLWAMDVTFTSNFVDLTFSPSGHLWSIAVEEQFYLLWPIAIVMFGLAARARTATRVLAVPIILAPIARVAGFKRVSADWPVDVFNAFSLFCYVDVLAIGCIAAFVFINHRSAVERALTRRPGPVALGAALVVVGPTALAHTRAIQALTVPLAFPVVAVGLAVLLLQSILLPNRGGYRLLNTPLVLQGGVLSYSIYVWHMLFANPASTYGLPITWMTAFPTWLVPAFGTAALSYYCLERPFMRLRARLRVA